MRRRGIQPVPIVFTFSVCGSLKTLEFPAWLGVDVPRWIQNDLRHADDTLAASFEHSLGAARELIRYCRRMAVPFGINVETSRSVVPRLKLRSNWPRCSRSDSTAQNDR